MEDEKSIGGMGIRLLKDHVVITTTKLIKKNCKNRLRVLHIVALYLDVLLE